MTSKQQLLENYIRKIVKQTIRESIFEADDNHDKNDSTAASRRQTVMNKLRQPSCNHAPYSKFLWPDLDQQSASSLFAKKVNHAPYEDGSGYYSFTNDEITKLYNKMSSENVN